MKFVDMNDDTVYTLADIKAEWEALRPEDPWNFAENFQTQLFVLIMDTINGRNDMQIIGPTPAEIEKFLLTLLRRIEKGEQHEGKD